MLASWTEVKEWPSSNECYNLLIIDLPVSGIEIM